MAVEPNASSREENRHTLLLNTLPYGVQENDTRGVITYSNTAHHRMLEFQPGELVGRCIWDFQPGEEQQRELQEYLGYLLSEQPTPQPYVTHNITGKGREIVVDVTWDYQRSETGEITGFISVISDITARTQTEQALQKSETNLAEAGRIAHIGCWELDLLENRLWWSSEVFRIFEIDQTRFTASYEAFLDTIHPDDREQVNRAYTDSLASHVPYDITHRLQFENGRIKYVRERCETFYDETGTALRSIGTVQDITEHYESEQALRYHKAQLRTLVDTLPDLVWLKDSAGTYLDCNRKFERFFGAQRAEIIGKNDFNFIDSDLARFFHQEDQESIVAGQPSVNEEWVTYADDGHHELLETIKTPLTDEQGKTIGVLGISRDITTRNQAEQAYRESESRYRELVDNMSDGVAVYEVVGDGEDFIFKEHNRAGERITGMLRNEVIGRSVREAFPGIEKMELFDLFKRVWRSGKPEHYPVRHYQDDRISLWVENYVFKLPGNEIVAIYEDATLRKKAETNLHYRLTLEGALTEVTASLVQAGKIGLGQAIDQALEHIGTAVGADRSYLFQIDEASATFSNTHEWCAEGVVPQKPELQQVPFEAFDAAFSRFREGRILHVKHPGDLDDALSALREYMQQSGIQSLINMPIMWEGNLRGVVGFDSEKADKNWPDEDLRLLRTVAENLGWALVSQESSQRIREHTWFLENLDQVSGILTREHDPSLLLQKLNDFILETLDADRTWLLYPCDPEAALIQIPAESTRPEFPGAFAEGGKIPSNDFSAEIKRQALRLDHPLVIQRDDISEPPEFMRHYQIQSLMAMVLKPDTGKPWLLGIHQCSHQRVWTAVEQRLFQAIAERAGAVLSGSQLLQQVRESERRLLEAEHIAQIGSWERDIQSGESIWSDQEYLCLGYEPRACKASHENFKAAVHPDDREWVSQAVQKALESDLSSYDIEHRIIWQDGSEHIVHQRGLVERDEEGNPLRMFGTTQDVTDRVRIEKELEAHRLHLEQLVEERTATIREQALIIDQTHDSVVTTNLDGYVTSWNGGAERVFGISAKAAIGRHISFLYADHQHDFLQREVVIPLKTKGTHEVEITLQHPDGSKFPAHLSLSLLYGNDGNPKGMVGYAVDISELKQREKDLKRLTRRLQLTNQELESFSYSVSHDLRAPLRAIDGFSLALVEDYGDQLDETARDYLHRVRKGAQRMGQLIDDLLLLSRVNRGELKLEQVDLSVIARSTIDELRAEDPARRLELTLDPGMQVQGDPRLLQIMLNNLLGNAWKFTSQEDITRIVFKRRGDNESVFCVSDNGVGFDMRYADKLFGAFQRLHRDADFPGTGIGLATVQRIVNRHGGKVWAEASEGNGATFYFSLSRSAQTRE